MIFITFEGIEGSGKSTQAKMLAKAFEAVGKEVLLTREPGGTELAEKIRTFIMDNHDFKPMTELLLHNAARYEHIANVIAPALKAQKIVICDRFVDSTMAYQGYAMKLGKKLPAILHNFCMENTSPNLTFILDLEAEIGLERSKKRGTQNRYEDFDLEFHRRVRNGFLDIAKLAPSRCFVINALRDISAMHTDVISIIQELFDFKIAPVLY
jgi:dTMP kinase